MQAVNLMSPPQTVDLLRSIDILADLSWDQLDTLSRHVRTFHFLPGQIIYTPEHPSETIFMLQSGTVKLYRMSPDGKIIITRMIQAGAIFSDMSLLGQNLYGNYAETLTECAVYSMNAQNVQNLLLNDIRIVKRIIETLSVRIHELEYQLSALALKPVPDRIVAILLFLHRQLAPVSLSDSYIRITHEELAHMVGANRESVTKALNDFQMQGLVELHRGRIKLIHPDQFQTSCQRTVI